MRCGERIAAVEVLLVVFAVVLISMCSMAYWHSWICSLNSKSKSNLNQTTQRIVLVADPQLEGHRLIRKKGTYGKLSVAFNDWYISWVYRSMVTQFQPNMSVVLGDLFSSQVTLPIPFQINPNQFKIRILISAFMFDCNCD